MFGTFRLLLAAQVALSHTIPSPPNFQLGVPAVLIFFMLSGFAISGLIHTRFATGSASPFYAERAIRLAPQYYFWLAYSAFISFNRGWAPVNIDGFMSYRLFCYLTVIPVGFQAYFGAVFTALMSQASSLAIEICYYIFAPWLLKS